MRFPLVTERGSGSNERASVAFERGVIQEKYTAKDCYSADQHGTGKLTSPLPGAKFQCNTASIHCSMDRHVHTRSLMFGIAALLSQPTLASPPASSIDRPQTIDEGILPHSQRVAPPDERIATRSASAVRDTDIAVAHGQRPALFGTGAESLLAKLQCPKHRASDAPVIVSCQASLTASGRLRGGDVRCLTVDSRNDNYAIEVENAIRVARFIPAAADGANLAVYMSFRVLFDWQKSVCTLMATPNIYQSDVTRNDSLHFVAPQKILSNLLWFRRREEMGRGASDARIFNRGVLFEASVAVTADGTASDPRLESNNGASIVETTDALHALERSSFIPAYFQGEFISHRYYEWFVVARRSYPNG